jgi:hypothetical protein
MMPEALIADGSPAVYKAAVRMLIRRAIRSLNEGNYQPALAMFASDAELTFPGDNVLAHQRRLVMMVRSAWGKIRSQEDNDDTERVAAFYKAHPEFAASELG